MNNILLLSSLYPSDDVQFKNNTAVCHYFAKEWARMGYNVRVINLYNEYPLLLYPFLKAAQGLLADIVPTAILAERKHKEHSYEIDGIKVTRLSVYKSKPHGDNSERIIKKIVNRIYDITQEENFAPDYILGHFLLPGIRIVAGLKDSFPQAITTISLHGKEVKLRQIVKDCLHKIDYVGYRSYPIKNSFESIYGKVPFFMCMSGVPASYISKYRRTFEGTVNRFVYVGNFMKRKYPALLIPAIYNNFPDKNFSITYVGDGNGIKAIKREIARYDVKNNVYFTGRIQREKVTKQMDNADVFIMISEGETFGLVHLEAMARGCITIASVNEGMDGIIINGENGFLCKSGDTEDLGRIIAHIKSMSQSSLIEMSEKAIETAKQMTDSKMAEDYIHAIKYPGNA